MNTTMEDTTMTMTMTAAETLADLEERVRSGDTSVTAAQLAKATDAAAFEQLQTEAAERAALDAKEATAKQARAQARAELAAAAGLLGDLRDQYTVVLAAIGELVKRRDSFRVAAHTARGAAVAAGIGDEARDLTETARKLGDSRLLDRAIAEAHGRFQIQPSSHTRPSRFVRHALMSDELVDGIRRRLDEQDAPKILPRARDAVDAAQRHLDYLDGELEELVGLRRSGGYDNDAIDGQLANLHRRHREAAERLQAADRTLAEAEERYAAYTAVERPVAGE